jgi:hypothetical protein
MPYTVKFRELKRRAQKELSARRGEPIQDQITAEHIERWDVRQVRDLIRAFPFIVPKAYHERPIYCEFEDSDDAPWVIHFT